MQRKRNKISTYNGYKMALAILFAIYIIFIIIMVLTTDSINAIFITSLVVGLIMSLGALIFGLIIVSGESEKNLIRILELNFDSVDVGMRQLIEIMPTIFIHCNYINTYVYNLHDRCYYEIYVKDEIRWMRNIGKRNPKERYYYGL